MSKSVRSYAVVIVCFAGIDFRARGQFEIEPLQAGDIGAETRRQEELNRLACSCDHQMNLQTVEVAALRAIVLSETARYQLLSPMHSVDVLPISRITVFFQLQNSF